MKAIEVNNIDKKFDYYKKEEGLKNSFRNLFYREKLEKTALENINFEIEKGEIVGLLGPNGAGKTTTIKLLSGIIYPTNGSMKVIGYTPWERKNDFKKKIAVIMAQKNQLWWDLPANESILLNSYIYGLTREEYKKSLDELVEIFGVKELLPVQVRRLSLGERMKFEIISSLIYKPEVIFLDEPTIGLDIIAQKEMRNFIKSYQEEYNATIVLTSHYMQDIEALCKRTIIINNGKKVYDGLLSEINNVDYKILSFYNQHQDIQIKYFEKWGKIKKIENDKIDIEVPKEKLRECLQYLVANNIIDFSIENMPIEENILSMYKKV